MPSRMTLGEACKGLHVYGTDRTGKAESWQIESPEAMYVRVGSAIKRRREDLGMTQAALASIVGLRRTSITAVELGRQTLTLHQFLAIAEALNTRASVLLPEMGTDRTLAQRRDLGPEMHELLSRLDPKRTVGR